MLGRHDGEPTVVLAGAVGEWRAREVARPSSPPATSTASTLLQAGERVILLARGQRNDRPVSTDGSQPRAAD
jgi:hypothetical protein